ncbi:MAG: ribonuclease P protein component [Patescibacteria group bacterium]
MLPVNKRLNRHLFALVNKTGKPQNFPKFALKSLENEVGFNRWSIVVSKKISKRAVVRNALRRKLYNIVVNIPGTHDYIIFVKNNSLLSEISVDSPIWA